MTDLLVLADMTFSGVVGFVSVLSPAAEDLT
jgi:hypothetical protein